MEKSEQPSPRLAWVIAHAAELIELASGLGARRISLCGSVARGDDTGASDIDFYVWEFAIETDEPSARRQADQLVRAFRSLSPYCVDVRGIPGWPLDPPFEESMQQDAIDLSTFLR
jgi:predicted nucleotidyltransferase